jgi:hypothetical protein
MERKMPGLTDNKRPVPIGMGKLFEENFQPVQYTDIPVKDIKKHPVSLMDRDIHPGVGKIDLKRF